MRTRDHYKLAKILINKEVGLFSLCNGIAFCIGNIAPDINLVSYLTFHNGIKITGHNYETAIIRVEKILRNLKKDKNIWGAYEYYKIGVILHYLVDSFTYVHNENFNGSIKEHCEYETKLHYLMKKITPNDIPITYHNNVKRELIKLVNDMHTVYLKNMNDVENDCKYILKVLSYIIATVMPIRYAVTDN